MAGATASVFSLQLSSVDRSSSAAAPHLLLHFFTLFFRVCFRWHQKTHTEWSASRRCHSTLFQCHGIQTFPYRMARVLVYVMDIQIPPSKHQFGGMDWVDVVRLPKISLIRGQCIKQKSARHPRNARSAPLLRFLWDFDSPMILNGRRKTEISPRSRKSFSAGLLVVN